MSYARERTNFRAGVFDIGTARPEFAQPVGRSTRGDAARRPYVPDTCSLEVSSEHALM
jgi:hypothetical protein